MYEIVWDTTAFNDKSLWPSTGQPFYLSQMDNTGYGQHGDYIFGWKGDSLQRSMSANCFGATCKELKTQSFTEANKCTVPRRTTEEVDGCTYL